MHHSIAMGLMDSDFETAKIHAQKDQAAFQRLVDMFPQDASYQNALVSAYLLNSEVDQNEGRYAEAVARLLKGARFAKTSSRIIQ